MISLPAGPGAAPQPGSAARDVGGSAAIAQLGRLPATVLGAGPQGLLLAVGDTAWLAQDAPLLRPGTPLILELTARTAAGWQGRLLTPDGAALPSARAVPIAAPATGAAAPAAIIQSPGEIAVEADLLTDGQNGIGGTWRIKLTPLPSAAVAADPAPAMAVIEDLARSAPPPAGATSGASQLAAPPPPAMATAGSGAPGRAASAGPQPASSAGAPAGEAASSAGASRPADPAPAATGQPPSLALTHQPLTNTVSLPARVAGADSLGRLLLQASGLTLRVAEPLALPADAWLQVQLPLAALAGSAAARPAALATPLAQLIELLSAVPENADDPPADPDPPPAPTAGPQPPLRLPQPDDQMAGRLLRLWQALGDASATATTRAAGTEAAPETAGLQRALDGLHHALPDEQQSRWQVLELPVGADAAQPLRLYQRLDQADEDGAGSSDDTAAAPAKRIILEIDFSALGRCQLDALCSGQRCDLLVRTEQPLPAALQAELVQLFRDAQAITGGTGELACRSAALLPLPQPHGRSPTGLTV